MTGNGAVVECSPALKRMAARGPQRETAPLKAGQWGGVDNLFPRQDARHRQDRRVAMRKEPMVATAIEATRTSRTG